VTIGTRTDTTGLVTALAAVRGCWSPSLSPDGAWVAFVSDLDGTSRAYVNAVGADGGWAPRAVSAAGEVVDSVSWSRSGSGLAPGWLLLVAQPAAGTRLALRAVRADGGESRALEAPPGGTAFAGCWAPGRPAYAFSTVGPDDGQVVLLDVETGERRVIAEGGGLLVTDVAADGRAVLRRGPRGRRHLVVPAEDGGLLRLVSRDLVGGSEDGRFDPRGRGVWLRTDAGRDAAHDTVVLGLVPLDGEGRPGPLDVVAARDDAELERFAVAADGSALVLGWNAGGVSELELLDPATGRRTPIPGLPWGVVGGLSLASDGRQLVVEATSPSTPRALLAVQLAAPAAADPDGLAHQTRVRRLSRVPVPRVDADRLVRPQLVQLEAHDGLPLAGWLYRPPGASGPVPTVVSLHGGPEAQERPVFSPLLQSLVAAGIAVLAPNVRGSSGYGRTFTERDSGLRRLDAVRDVLSCTQWLTGRGLAEPGRLGVHGTSYGGYLVLASIVEYPETFAAAASVCGIADFLTFFAGTEPWIAHAARTKYGDPRVDAALLRRLSPLHQLHAARTPTLLVHGEEDTNVPVAEALQAHAALRSGGVPSELVVVPGEGHSLLRPESRLAELTAVVAWFRRWL